MAAVDKAVLVFPWAATCHVKPNFKISNHDKFGRFKKKKWFENEDLAKYPKYIFLNFFVNVPGGLCGHRIATWFSGALFYDFRVLHEIAF